MFSQIFTSLLLASTMYAGALAKPIPSRPHQLISKPTHSFNHWGGFSSLDNFDHFYGADNFDGSRHFSQTIVQDKQLVCRTQQVQIIQQRLVVLQEMAKRIITELVCDVETQTIVFEQWHGGLGNFRHDLRRVSGHQVGFDHNIVGHFDKFFQHDGSWNLDDWHFTGHDIGKQTVIVKGHNWVDSHSPVTVGNAWWAAHNAYISLHPEYRKSIIVSPPFRTSSSSKVVSSTEVTPSIDPSISFDPTISVTADPSDAPDSTPSDDAVTDVNINANATDAPADGDNTAIPADGDNTAIPADGDNTAIPADGDNTAIPADGDNAATPAA